MTYVISRLGSLLPIFLSAFLAVACGAGGAEPTPGVDAGGAPDAGLDLDASPAPDADPAAPTWPPAEGVPGEAPAAGDFVDVCVAGGRCGGDLISLGHSSSIVVHAGDAVAWGRADWTGRPGGFAALPLGVTAPRDVAMGAGIGCIVDAGGQLRCWGENDRGQLGLGTSSASPEPTPVAVPGMVDVVDACAARNHVCAVRADGSLWCWGNPEQGRLGFASVVDVPSPRQVPDLDVVKVACEMWHTCALLRDGRVACFGENRFGQLGNGTVSDGSSGPTIVRSLTDAVDIEVSLRHSCARRSSGELACWGRSDYGGLGTGWTADGCGFTGDPTEPEGDGASVCVVPVAIPGMPLAHDLALMDTDTCVVAAADGALWCVGNNSSYQQGTGMIRPPSREWFLTPHTTLFDDGAIELDGAERHLCLRYSDDEVRCAGWNYHGQADPSAPSSTTPTATPVLISLAFAGGGDD